MLSSTSQAAVMPPASPEAARFGLAGLRVHRLERLESGELRLEGQLPDGREAALRVTLPDSMLGGRFSVLLGEQPERALVDEELRELEQALASQVSQRPALVPVLRRVDEAIRATARWRRSVPTVLQVRWKSPTLLVRLQCFHPTLTTQYQASVDEENRVVTVEIDLRPEGVADRTPRVREDIVQLPQLRNPGAIYTLVFSDRIQQYVTCLVNPPRATPVS